MNKLTLVYICLFLAGCVTEGYTIIPPNENEIQEAREIIAQQGEYRRNNTPLEYDLERLNRVSESLSEHATNLCQALGERSFSDCDYHIFYEESEVFNAYATEEDGENKIIVTTELLDHVHSDDELALVVGHEIGHHIANHFSDQTGFTIGEGLGLLIGAAIVSEYSTGYESSEEITNILSTTSQIGGAFDRPGFSRGQETEADMIGHRLLSNAGYSPLEAVNLLTTMATNSSEATFFSTHPSGEERVANFIKFYSEPSYLQIVSAENLLTCGAPNCDTSDFNINPVSFSSSTITKIPDTTNNSKIAFSDNRGSFNKALVQIFQSNDRLFESEKSYDSFVIGNIDNSLESKFLKNFEKTLDSDEYTIAIYYEKALWAIDGVLFTNKGAYINYVQNDFINFDAIGNYEFSYKDASLLLDNFQYKLNSDSKFKQYPTTIGVNHRVLFYVFREIQDLVQR